ncbi:CvpA family protein [Campylobacter hyointestinalis]|uniref:CvpA family protein n=4 Tax=Campylobacter hyointestinalis TaxID=198 RepID=A0A9W5AP91_CAMHY|nr:CvpA family protein [Campylobacter hyointestinalis]ANE32297.1 putative membrane protein, CvpA family [Campylobacter hyointestinalis subsp. hyointestinalis LMG 9260]MDL2347540.1 CvpA family protein [Campylobacter hyointestinalis]MDL2349242.1 CvpA family protein [Campylobacter hyointestinalis]MDL2351030.1 CvpA family protein [Campylobacter hyointestinalis]MDM1026860.1 CvpA family protein [Campylobacter hyointestinalis]
MMNLVTWFDIIVIALVVILGIKGLINGFVKEIFGLIGLIGGVVVASRNATLVGGLISDHIYKLNESSSFFFGFLATLVIFWVVCLVAGNLVSKMLTFSGLGFLDRILGFFIGSAKIFLVFAIFAAIISNINILSQKIEPYFDGSKVYPLLLSSGKFIMNVDINQTKQEILDMTGTDNNVSDTNESIKEK